MSLFQSGTIYLQKTNFDELFFKLYLVCIEACSLNIKGNASEKCEFSCQRRLAGKKIPETPPGG